MEMCTSAIEMCTSAIEMCTSAIEMCTSAIEMCTSAIEMHGVENLFSFVKASVQMAFKSDPLTIMWSGMAW
jgi:hypothetical protein